MDRRALRWGLVLLCAAGGVARAAPNAEIVSLEGKGEFREAQVSSWRAATVKQALLPTNFVRTGDLSRMAILFPDRTQVRLAQNSTLQIKEAAAGTDAKTILNLNSGRSWVQSKSAPQGLIMETPSALAAIRGTDWEMAVEDDGRSTLSVFSGEVEFSNAQGGVVVGANEQAVAEKGKAPVKLALRTSRTRVQWVSSLTVDPARYAELRGDGREPRSARAAASLIREARLGEAYDLLRRETQGAAVEPVALLLLAEFEIYRGDLGAARAALQRGARLFPDDERFAAQLAHVALQSDDRVEALAIARAAVARRPDSVEALVALGDIERLEGNAREASIAYGRATQRGAADPRGWYGLGVIESERENVRRGRGLLSRAITLDEANPTYRAELGTLETFAGDLAAARASLERAVVLQPDHYVAWTGLGILALKAGDIERALDALLRATLIEPRYARAHLYLAAAYYEQERATAALASLARAAESDPRDPLPYLLASIIYLDRIQPGEAAAQAREALARIPFLRSANQVADNQKGVANVGSALATLGLESWSRSMAHESYLPFWGASHLFLADRYPGEFNRRSELMQGFITNPIAFGASNRFQSLVTTPGHHATASMRLAANDDLWSWEPVATFNGLVAAPVPLAYFVEGIETHIEPRGTALDARGRTLTAALGIRPIHELSAFLYANRLAIDADIGLRSASGLFQRIDGVTSRVDAGLRYAPTADASWWLKAGAEREHSTVRDTTTIRLPDTGLGDLSRFSFFDQRPTANDVALRGTFETHPGFTWTAGAEQARAHAPKTLARDAFLHFESPPSPQESLDERDTDRSRSAYAFARWKGERVLVEGGAVWRDYRKDRRFHAITSAGPGDFEEHHRRTGTDGALGATLRMTPGLLLRGACRDWLRPIALDTLLPVAVAGIPLDDQFVLAGGTLRQCNAELDWTLTPTLFATLDASELRVRNLVSPLDGVLNTRVDATNLDRLRNRTLSQPGKPDQLEDDPVYAEGRLRRAHAAVEALLTRSLSARLHYTYADGLNTAEATRGRRIPYVARHTVNTGVTWSPGGRVFVTTLATYRTRRFADDMNLQPLPAGWDAQVTVFVETPDKRWALEAFASNLLKKETSDTFGVLVSYRF
ncbi:MAG TPA: FecR domain-containing protein [Usitatibacter sp.]|nr:FecR domain-containing protein [Usitatibacter sp.]